MEASLEIDRPLMHSLNQLLGQLTRELHAQLPANLVGLYLRGSLVSGDFRPASSDVDLLAVTYQRINDAEFARLAALHHAIAHSDQEGEPPFAQHPFAQRIEIAYIERAALRRYEPGQRFPTLGQGETLQWTEHHANWILERWMVREQGIALFGPLPMTLIDPIPRQAITVAVQSRLQDWATWASDAEWEAEWHWPRHHKFYVVETMCRALHTLTTGEITSKPRAVKWALAHLPDPWRTLVSQSQSWQFDDAVDDSLIAPLRAFVLWVAREKRVHRNELGQHGLWIQQERMKGSNQYEVRQA